MRASDDFPRGIDEAHPALTGNAAHSHFRGSAEMPLQAAATPHLI